MFLTAVPESDTPESGLESPAEGTALRQAPVAAASPAWERVEDQIGWYDRKSQFNQRRFKWLKTCQIVTAAALPLLASIAVPAWLIGSAGALIVILEGLQQLQQYQQNWTGYRATSERLKHERFLFQAKAGPY